MMSQVSTTPVMHALLVIDTGEVNADSALI
jgi:hypothetical protein